jgi:hypothetical protein
VPRGVAEQPLADVGPAAWAACGKVAGRASGAACAGANSGVHYPCATGTVK